MTQTTTTQVCPEKAKRRVPALRGGQSDDLAAGTVRCDRISLQRVSMGRKIAFKSSGIWGMFDWTHWLLMVSLSALSCLPANASGTLTVNVTPIPSSNTVVVDYSQTGGAFPRLYQYASTIHVTKGSQDNQSIANLGVGITRTFYSPR